MSIGEKILKEVPNLGTGNPKWEVERAAFWKMHAELLRTHLGKWVAIHNGQVVDSDNDHDELSQRVYAKYGYIPIYFQKVLPEGLRTLEVGLG